MVLVKLFTMNGLYNPVTIIPTWQMYLLLEIMTVIIEFLFFAILYFDKETRHDKWSVPEVFVIVFFANVISAIIGMMILMTTGGWF